MSEQRRRIKVLPLILALLPVFVVLFGIAHGNEPHVAFADVVREVPPGSTEPGVYRPAATDSEEPTDAPTHP